MFTYQYNTRTSPAVACDREVFWKTVRKPQNKWRIDSRRDILDVVERHDTEGIARWLNEEHYVKYAASMKAQEGFQAKSDEERLLAFAQTLKDSLPTFIFSCRAFDASTVKGRTFCRRRLADCHLNGLVMLDIDHVEHPEAIYEELQRHEELMKRTALVHITSSKRGLRIVFTANIDDGNLADNIIVFAAALGQEADTSCIDATRNSFCPSEEDILYINEELLFDYYDEAFDKKFTPMYRKRETQPTKKRPTPPVGHPSRNGGEAGVETAKSTLCAANERSEALPLTGERGEGPLWLGYRIQDIINARFAEKLPCAADSNRHKSSLKLASDLLILFDGDKAKVLEILLAQTWVQDIIKERGENVQQTVDSAAERMAEREKKYLNQSPSTEMQEAIQKVCGKTYKELMNATGATTQAQPTPLPDGRGQGVGLQLANWGSELEALFPQFPILSDICKGLKPSQYPAAVFVGGGLLMTLMTRCTYRFYHRPEELRRLNNSTLIIGDPASGKSFATRLYKLLAAPIVEADREGKEAINAYREQMKTKGANKEKPKKPKVKVRIHPARTSNAQFIQDMVNTVEEVDGQPMQLHMLTFDTELDNTVTVQKGGSWIDKQSLELKAFHNEEDGQAYSNVDSILQDFYVTWNFIYTGTPIALKKKVNESNFGSGLATRLTCIPLPATNFEMMERESGVDLDSDKRLREWAFKLDKTKGELSLQKIVDELYDWTARRMMDAQDNDSRADEMLLKRCAYHGLNFAAPFIVMRHWAELKQDGAFWCGEFETDDTDWQLAELLTNIQYACQRHFFGHLAEKYFEAQQLEAVVNVRRQQKTIDAFERLPEEFTTEDVMRCFNLNSEGAARSKMRRLMKDNLIRKNREVKEGNVYKAVYEKTGAVML